jgi:RHS repeat-associated protein
MRSKTITNHDWSLNVATDHNYEETVTYDANGNIRTYWRNQETGFRMDQLKYNYDETKKNRLLSVNDVADPTPTFKDDVEGTETFEYDAIGNLTKHTKPTGVQTLAWNAYGKVKSVTQTGVVMHFGYDAQQNRLKKTVNGVTSYYIRDAQGNTLAVYEQNGASLVWKEQDLYGSSRLGMAKPEREVTGFFWASAAYTLVAGAKSYELSNHLGNVLAVISDRGELQSAQDYFPFGMAMPGRSTGAYRYGFNGKETDPETGIQDYGMRWYLPNIGRFPSVDPITAKYPELTPYQFASNMPIAAIDLDGAEAKLIITTEAYRWTVAALYTDKEKGDWVVVCTYKMNLVNAQTGEIIHTYNVVRDSPYEKKDGTKIDRAFEPADGRTNLYAGVQIDYHKLPAFKLHQKGSECLHAKPFTAEDNKGIDEPRKDLGVATGVMVHIGGLYINDENELTVAGYYGCFGVVPTAQTYATEAEAKAALDSGTFEEHTPANANYKKFVDFVAKKVQELKHQDTRPEKDRNNVLIVVEKREDKKTEQNKEEED